MTAHFSRFIQRLSIYGISNINMTSRMEGARSIPIVYRSVRSRFSPSSQQPWTEERISLFASAGPVVWYLLLLIFFCRSAPNVKIVAQSFTALPIFLSLSVCVQPALWSMPVRFPSLGDALCALRKVRVLLNRLSKSSMYSTTILLLFRLVARRWWIDLFICFTSLSHSAEWWIRWPTGHESAVACWPMQL